MNSILIKIPTLSICLFALLGCSSASHKPSEMTSASASTVPPLPAHAYLSLGSSSVSSNAKCPASDKSWRKENLETLSRYANACALSEKYDRLAQIGNYLAQRHHLLPWGAYYLSLSAEGEKQYARALWMAELAINKSPRTAMLYYQRGRIYWYLGEHSKAVESYNIAIRENPKFLDAHLFLGELYFRDQNFKLAEKHFKIVLAIDANNTSALAGLAEIYENVSKDYAQALSSYRRLKLLMAETRRPAHEIAVDVNEKILRLETILNQNKAEAKKISERDEESRKRVHK